MRVIPLLVGFLLTGCPCAVSPSFAPTPNREDVLQTMIPSDLVTSCNSAAQSNPQLASLCNNADTVSATFSSAERGNPLVGEVPVDRYEIGPLILFVDRPRKDESVPQLTSAYLVSGGQDWMPEDKLEHATIYVESMGATVWTQTIAAQISDGDAQITVRTSDIRNTDYCHGE